jgi:mannose-1-phosphate guanylyltransferase
VNVFFLAAGLGTRLKPLTHFYPKPAGPFLNVPLGLYQFRFLEQLNVSSCVANSFHLPDKIQQLYQQQNLYSGKIQISNEHPAILGSAGGLKKAAQFFSSDETLLMMNADEIFFTPQVDFLTAAYQQHLKNKNLATLITMQHPEAGKKFGAIWCEQNKVRHIGKETINSALKPKHYIGIIFLNRKILDLIPENLETNIFYDVLIRQLKTYPVETFDINCTWFETGNWTDYFTATQATLQNLDQPTLDFINSYDPSHLVKNATGISLISNSVKIDESSLSGYNVIGKNQAQLPKKIENSVVFADQILNASYFSQAR